MFHIWINCAFFDSNGVIIVNKMMLDKAFKVYIYNIIKKDKKHSKFS